jgi:diguanylate cyclase (GGDEF)-like protein
MDILVLHQDLSERPVIQQVLEQSRHVARFVETMDEALQAIRESAFRFIIVDATEQEPGFPDFIKTIRRAPSSRGHTYVLLLVKKDQNIDQFTNAGINADDYLGKPITPQNLKARVAIGVRILSMGDTLAQVNRQLENLAMYDNLTGLMNRQAFYNVSQGELERSRRKSEGLSVIALDVNNFKDINNAHGHSVGDDVLKVVAQIIREKSRPYDCIGRWAGDQFILILPGIVSADAEKIIKRILAGVKSSDISLANGDALEVKLSAGIASTQTINAYAEIDTFIQSAVQALLNSKQNGEDEICVVYI